MAHKFAGLGKKTYLYEEKNGQMKKFRQTLWGDWLEIDPNRSATGEYLPIIWAKNCPEKRKELWVKENETQDTRPLEIIFLDVGQGDGAVLVTPERDGKERIIVIDAGEQDHMHRFLATRFHSYRGFTFHAAIITHPDKDHYGGFADIFTDHNVGFDKVYHNGLMELPVSGRFEKIGGKTRDTRQKVTYVNRIWETHEEVVADFSDDSDFGDFEYPPVVHAAIENPNIGNFEILSTKHGVQEEGKSFVPEFAPTDGRPYTIEVLGPVVEEDSDGNPKLRTIGGSYGKTKNGHSILLQLKYGDFKVFFGGDLNRPAEEFLIKHYTGQDRLPADKGQLYDAVVTKARERFRSEVMKVCHHGASDVTDIFLDSVNPAAFIISSGDEEGHVHPRPDLLGRLGRFGRGESPVLLSTELQRSSREKEDAKDQEKLIKLISKIKESASKNRVKTAEGAVEDAKAITNKLSRNNVDVYGSIYVKTDGERLITAFKIETDSATKKWFYFEYIIDGLGIMTVVD